MNKKVIVNNTLIFIGILLFINVFNILFGKINSVVGVTVITAALTLLQRDLTVSFLDNFLKIIAINVATGILAQIANINIGIGIVVNFLALFGIGYLFSSNLKTSVVVPFGLQYLFMLFTPVSGEDFSLRISGLIFGGVFIMLLQYLFNRKRLLKIFKPTVVLALDEIIGILEQKQINHEKVTKKLNLLKRTIYDSREKNYFMTMHVKNSTDVVYLLERVNIILANSEFSDEEEKEVLKMVIAVKDFVKDDSAKDVDFNIELLKSNIRIKEIARCLSQIAYESKEFTQNLDLKRCKKQEIHKDFSAIKIIKDNFNLKSLKVTYGLRLAIIGTVSIFLVNIFNIEHGRWIVYTIFSLLQPYTENSNIRVKQRIIGTVVGALFITIAFSFIKDNTGRGMIVLLSGYLNTYTKHYGKLMVLVTASSVASVIVSGGAFDMAFLRVMLVCLGGILSFIGTKFILPYEINDGNKEIQSIYDKIISKFSDNIKDEYQDDGIKALFLLPGFFEDKLLATNICSEKLKEINIFIKEKRIMLNELYGSYYFNKSDCNFIDDTDEDSDLVLN